MKTYEIVREIAKCAGHKIWITRLVNPFVWIAGKVPGKMSVMVNKAFGNLVYEKSMSMCFDEKYQVRNLKESVRVTEGKRL